MKKLFIDLGHSKRFPGASGYKNEVDWNRAVAAVLVKLIDPTKWQVIMVPTEFSTDRSANSQLINRINWINRNAKATDYLLSLHGNGSTNHNARGVYTCYMGGFATMRQQAIALSKSYALSTGIPLARDGSFDDRSGRFGRIGMVRDTHPLALLIEMGFCSNIFDMAVPAVKAAQGIANYYNAL
jgi:N-acetylmuramoyl-L-alanine amidase